LDLGGEPVSGLIFHLAEEPRWQQALDEGTYTPAAFEEDGFIHRSESRQLAGVADLLFRGRQDLVILAIREDRLTAQVRRENLEGGDALFPHVYGPVQVEAVETVYPARPGADGRFELSAWLVELAE
jgi:uncharacterized protein (DUF952 family)